MKKIIAAGLMTGMALAGLAVGAGTANARPYCETGGYDPAQNLCVGGPYGPVPVRWLPDTPYYIPPGPTSAPRQTTGEWWDTPSQGQAMCGMVKVGGRDWAVNNGIGSLNGTAEGARMVDTLISKYCPQYAR